MKKKKAKNNIDPDFIGFFKCTFVVILLASAFGLILQGMSDAQSDSRWKIDECKAPLSRYEYIFPFYRLGCWLGEVPEEKTCDKTSEN